ncbi:MAG TPA: response regulator transcription factor [Gaiellaceae bacterium]|nr:response regulator transcription factor [Gaiellaceae bacterium]
MIRVLLIDDHTIVRAGLRSRLDAEGDIAVVGEAGSTEAGIARARALQPDVVMMDILMPGGSGIDALPELARVAPDAKVLMLSSQASPSTVRQALTAGAAGYITKGRNDTDVLAAVRSVASGTRYVEPELGAQLVVADSVPELEPLSDRERDVLQLLALGYMNQEIGKKLYISVRTVDTHRAHIMRKLGLSTRAELVLFALGHGLIGA